MSGRAGGRTGGEDLLRWPKSLQEIFGPHSLEDHGLAAVPREIVARRRGTVRMWRVRHGAQALSVRGFKRNAGATAEAVRHLLRTGSFLLLIVERGKAVVEIYNGPIALSNGDGLLLTSLEPFRFVTCGMFTGIWMELPVWWLLELCRGDIIGARSRLDGKRGIMVALRAAVALCFADCWLEDETTDILDVFGDVLVRNLRAAARDDPPLERQIHRIYQFVVRNYRNESVSPTQAAQALGCSLSSIHKCCAAAGMTFGRMLTEMRLSAAAYKLSRERRSVSEIAFECGFSSLSHFCHKFKSRYGVSASTVQLRHGA